MIRKSHEVLPFRFPFSVFPCPLLRTHSLLLGWVRPHAKSGNPGLGVLTPRPHSKAKPFRSLQPRANTARGGIGDLFPLRLHAAFSAYRADCRSVMQAEELRQSYAS